MGDLGFFALTAVLLAAAAIALVFLRKRGQSRRDTTESVARNAVKQNLAETQSEEQSGEDIPHPPPRDSAAPRRLNGSGEYH